MIAPLRVVKRTEMLVELADFVYHDVFSAVVALKIVSMKKIFCLICAVCVVLNNMLGVQDWLDEEDGCVLENGVPYEQASNKSIFGWR